MPHLITLQSNAVDAFGHQVTLSFKGEGRKNEKEKEERRKEDTKEREHRRVVKLKEPTSEYKVGGQLRTLTPSGERQGNETKYRAFENGNNPCDQNSS